MKNVGGGGLEEVFGGIYVGVDYFFYLVIYVL